MLFCFGDTDNGRPFAEFNWEWPGPSGLTICETPGVHVSHWNQAFLFQYRFSLPKNCRVCIWLIFWNAKPRSDILESGRYWNKHISDSTAFYATSALAKPLLMWQTQPGILQCAAKQCEQQEIMTCRYAVKQTNLISRLWFNRVQTVERLKSHSLIYLLTEPYYSCLRPCRCEEPGVGGQWVARF